MMMMMMMIIFSKSRSIGKLTTQSTLCREVARE